MPASRCLTASQKLAGVLLGTFSALLCGIVLAYVEPQAGAPGALAALFGNLPDVITYLDTLPLENANQIVSNILLP